MPCPEGDFQVTPRRPSFHGMETYESPLVGRGKKSARWHHTWCKQLEQLKFLFFVNKKLLLIELSYIITQIHAISYGMKVAHKLMTDFQFFLLRKFSMNLLSNRVLGNLLAAIEI